MPKPPRPEMAVVVTFSEIFNRPATVEGARELLAQYKREAVLLVLAKLGAALRLWDRPDFEKDNGLARDVFKNAHRAQNNSMVGTPRRLHFTRLGVLATARLAVSACDNQDASEITEPRQAVHVMACCLMMNELTARKAPQTGVADLLLHQLSHHNAMARYDFRADLLRSLEMFERNRELLAADAGTIDLEAELKRATGLSARRFIEICLVVCTQYRMMNAGSLIHDDPTFFVNKDSFGNMTTTDAEMTSFFATVAQTPQQLAEYLPAQGERPLADITVFQSWPVIRVHGEERYYCCDVASLMDKTGRGLYWTLFGAADKHTRGKLGGTYGRAFEAYLHGRVRRAGFARDAYMEGLRFANGDEVCDGIFVDESRLILCEYKSSVLRADAKLSGQLDLLEPEIDKKFVRGDEGGRKGIAQLSRSIERLLRGERVVGLPSRNWSIVQPVMVCLEHAMVCPGMSGYINDRFDRTTLRRLSGTKVAPITLIDIEDFEDLLPDMKDLGLGKLLEEYYHVHMRGVGGRNDQLVPFRRKNVPFLDDKQTPLDEKEGAFRDFFNNLGTRLFG